MLRFARPVFASLLLAVVVFPAGASVTNRFGFSGPDVFPIDWGISSLRAGDLDGDGLNDLVAVNNARSKITLLFNQTGKSNRTATATVRPSRRELNELPPDSRFRLDSIASEKRIFSLVLDDLNGDSRPDLAYFGEPKELIVQYNLGTNGWSPPKRWALDDGLLEANALTSGDVNGDRLPDLLLIAEKHLYVLTQRRDRTLAEPEKITYNGTARAVQVLDLDGDQRDDLLLVNWDNPNPFRFRLQIEAGQLGPEIHLPLQPIRAYWADDLDGDHRTEIITIAQKSGRAGVANFTRKDAEIIAGEIRDGQFQVLPLNRTEKTRRGLAWADINRDGRTDLLVADPDAGQLSVQFQNPDGSLAVAKQFPTLTGVSEIDVADWDADGTPEVFLLSNDEKQVGVTSLDANGRLPFPRIISTGGRPLAMAVGAPKSDAHPVLAIVTDNDGKRELVTRTADGKTQVQKLNDNFKSNPSSMAWHDADHDGMADLIVLIPYEKVKVLVQLKESKDDRHYDEADVNPPGGNAEQPWLATADVDGDGKSELLLAQKNFLRAVVLVSDGGERPTWSFQVREQINGASSSSKIVGAAALPAGEGRAPYLFLLDSDRKVLTLCERDSSGVWQARRNLPLPVTDFAALQAVALGSTRPNTVAFLGVNAVAWKALSGQVWEFTELDGYESPIKDGFLHDIVSGDLNRDGRKDLVFLEVAKNHVDLVTFEAPHQLVPANRWQVFEERTFRQRNPSAEPREAVVVDLTGDGRNDLAIIVHDRVLVYPQE